MKLGRSVGAAVAALVVVSCSGEPSFSDMRRGAIDTCRQAVTKALRDPDSAKFAEGDEVDAYAPSGPLPGGLVYDGAAGDTHFEVSGMVNAKNAFGGYTGMKKYTCDAVVTKFGSVKVWADTSALTAP
ncbi:hypothetical protein [Mycobacteroides abscessus]|uniref:hypothetical protein n=1 Tax=Mycobacteroides abscessus TaxID=36809 RepID=UPI000925AE9C|nr:hypothetical protein [Mycobacteroides abscessus]MDO3024354.1 hypothetical protein [Mycobacteroides abscessus subsp. abscessus]SID26755.1 Uncharacterised protein [Mycobacteroides abscessus subsp. abscessus]SKO11904.1 Uncharacterised protein [Mycobacteroides abscessus subsp. abscessus]SKU87137.1 Uncharacterised protein [Mycobacteroides abscessus subsp. abscessus]SLD71542.1 Uncharacterised protein [Mycobacteroides abscessus subsp. massiliense]